MAPGRSVYVGEGHLARQRVRPLDGKIKRFDCYPSGTVILSRLGVIANRSAAPKA